MVEFSAQSVKQSTARIEWVDCLKGLLILFVVLGHIFQGIVNDYEHNLFWRLIYSFHMPVFMAISGFCCYKNNVKANVIKRRFIQLMLPFIVWSFYKVVIGELTIQNIILHPDSSFWFLYVLFVISAIHAGVCLFSQKLRINSIYVSLGVALFFIAIMSVLNIRICGFQFVSFHYAFYALGWYTRCFKVILFPILDKCKWFLLVLFPLSAFFWNFHEVPSFLPTGSSIMFCFIYRYWVAIIAFFAFIIWFEKRNVNLTLLKKLGKVTLGIYIIHLVLPQFLYDWLLPPVQWLYSVPYVLFKMIIVTLLSYIVCNILLKNKYTALILLGQK